MSAAVEPAEPAPGPLLRDRTPELRPWRVGDPAQHERETDLYELRDGRWLYIGCMANPTFAAHVADARVHELLARTGSTRDVLASADLQGSTAGFTVTTYVWRRIIAATTARDATALAAVFGDQSARLGAAVSHDGWRYAPNAHPSRCMTSIGPNEHGDGVRRERMAGQTSLDVAPWANAVEIVWSVPVVPR